MVDVARAAGAAADGSVYVAGRAGGSFVGETGGGLRGYLRKYAPGGTELWTRRLDTIVEDTPFGIAVDAGGAVYVVATVNGGLTGLDVSLRRYDPDGTEVWTRQFGTASSDTGFGVAVDGAGGVYVAGETSGTFPGQVSAGGSDAFLARYDTSGTARWTRQVGAPTLDRAYGVAADSGGAYIAGILATTGFVERYDATGTLAWDRHFAVGDARGVAADGTGGVYVTGLAFGTFDGQTSAGNVDAFLRRYDSAGGEVWTRQFGTSNRDEGLGVAVDGVGAVYVAGRIASIFSQFPPDGMAWKLSTAGDAIWTRQFGTSAADGVAGVAAWPGGVVVPGDTRGTFPGETSAGDVDAFVRGYDPAGNVAWTRQFGTVSPAAVVDAAYGVATDDAGGTYAAGRTNGALPGQQNAGSYDAFLRKYDAAGAEAWTREFGGAGFDQATGVAADAAGAVYVTGETRTAAGDSDAFLRKYDAAGAETWTRQFGTAESESVSGIAVDSSGAVFVLGSTGGAFPGRTDDGGLDTFLATYDSAGNEISVRQVGFADNRRPLGLATDNAGGAYAVGQTSDIDPETGDPVSTVVLWKYDPAGTVVWERQGLQRPGGAAGVAAVTVDGAGGVYWTDAVSTARRDWDVLVHKTSADGTELWTRRLGTNTYDAAFGIAARGDGVYVTGHTQGAFDGGTSDGGFDVFLRKYSLAGQELWTRQLDVALNDTPHGVAVDAAGQVSVAGETSGAGGSDNDAFVARVDRIK